MFPCHITPYSNKWIVIRPQQSSSRSKSFESGVFRGWKHPKHAGQGSQRTRIKKYCATLKCWWKHGYCSYYNSDKSLSVLNNQTWQLLNKLKVKLVMLETAGRRAGRHSWPDGRWSFRCKRWSVLLVVMWWAWWVAGMGESGPFEAQPEVPGLNADSLHVIKNSLS